MQENHIIEEIEDGFLEEEEVEVEEVEVVETNA